MATHHTTIGILAVLAAGFGTSPAAVSVDDFGRPATSGLRTDDEFTTNGPFFYYTDPGNYGSKAGLEVADPSGQDLRWGVGFGYDDNPWLQDDGFEEDSYYYRAYLLGSTIIRDPQRSIYLGAGAGYTYYERDEFRDQSVFDLEARAGYKYDFSDSLRWNTFVRADYGQHLPHHLGPVKEGLQQDYVLRYYVNSRLDYRWDQQPLGSNGWQASTSAMLTGFDSDDMFASQWADYHRLEGRQTLYYVVNPDLQVGLQGRFSAADYKYEPDNIDNESMDLVVTLDGRIAPAWTYRVETGLQWREYDSPFIADRDEFYYLCRFTWEAANDLFISGVTSYAIEDTYNNMFNDHFFEPHVYKAGFVASQDLGGVTLRGLLEGSRLDGDIFGGSEEITRYRAGIAADWEVPMGRLTTGYSYTGGERDLGGPEVDFERNQFYLNMQIDY